MKVKREELQRRFPVISEKVLTDLVPAVSDRVFASTIRHKLEALLAQKPFPMMHKVEIELFNRCNNDCPFCPVNRHDDPRKPIKIKEELFTSIVDQLGEMGFTGRLALHSNSEPMLDKRIQDFAKQAKRTVPGALLYFQTNGTRLTIEKFLDLTETLDQMVINNYSDDFEMIPPVKEVYEYCQDHPGVGDNVTIVMKNLHIRRSNRAGNAPNSQKREQSRRSPCLRPFKEMIIRPDGKLSLCCFDALGEMTMGDLTETPILEAWRGEPYDRIRRQMIEDRSSIGQCAACDEVILGESLALVEKHGTLKIAAGLARNLLPRRK